MTKGVTLSRICGLVMTDKVVIIFPSIGGGKNRNTQGAYLMPSTLLKSFSQQYNLPFSIKLPDAQELQFGNQNEKPLFQLAINTPEGLKALKSGDELKMAEAYLYEDIDLIGRVDMLNLLNIKWFFSKKHPIIAGWIKVASFLGNQVAANKRNIAKHYDFDPAFYLSFLDKTRVYSHGIFLNDDEPLEQGATRKLEFAMNSCHLTPGKSVLDLGAGWGSATEFLGKHGVQVDAITISKESAAFISNLINQNPELSQCQVFEKDFLEYVPPQNKTYDAIVSLGSLEHLPNYKAVLEKSYALLNKGGYAYYDAAASLRSKVINSYFITRHIFPGNHKCLDIYHFLEEIRKSPFELISVHNDRHNYYLSLKKWAENLEKQQDVIIQKWGKTLYRKFHLYLWGCCHSMMVNDLQAYRVVVRKP